MEQPRLMKTPDVLVGLLCEAIHGHLEDLGSEALRPLALAIRSGILEMIGAQL